MGVIELHRVARLFDGMPAISQVDLEVQRGARVWLSGTNGSGKSTLLRVVATALSPTFGGGTVCGLDLVRQRNAVRARVELLGHDPRFYRELTARENLRFVCSLTGADAGRIDGALERVGLVEVADVRFASFSQGMRQRLALARCLVREPEVVLLDEPYAGLDEDARSVVDDVLVEAGARGRTVLLASHEQPPDGLVDRRVVMDAGRVVAHDGALR
ncbi:ABC transporter ATP-binding protein [Nocardioides sp.]|uniref:ABC transporter ATP-binding protein n=1 Tax=Nocardioides sp. TaxID=35761 RepID=UPI002609DCBC|nr:ABC transporter ATP-binding protein [Nocardioides sp.]MDI6909830.1 ABC transporter ATP-binding protein [Nocardioides sp.]